MSGRNSPFNQFDTNLLKLVARVLTNSINSDTIQDGKMDSVEKIIHQMTRNPQGVRFADLRKVCDHYFGDGHEKSGHIIYKTPWQGDPRINIQNDRGKAKAYQVRQVLKAIARLEL